MAVLVRNGDVLLGNSVILFLLGKDVLVADGGFRWIRLELEFKVVFEALDSLLNFFNKRSWLGRRGLAL